MTENNTDSTVQGVTDNSDNFGFKHREGQLIRGETIRMTDEQKAALKKRNRAVALSLIAFMGLIFAVTVMRLSQNIAASAGG